MSNIEPTEEQKQAATAFARGNGFWSITNDLAHLLAEREAKLREEVLASYKGQVATLNANNDQLVRALDEGGFCYPASNVARFIVHDRLESSGDWYDPATSRTLHMDPAKAFAMQDENDTLRARVADLERPNWLTTPTRSTRSRKDRLKEARERETALTKRVAELEDLVKRGRRAAKWGIEDRWLVTDFLASTAHYDDAKDDAPASTEGGEG